MPDREPQEPVGDAAALALLLWNGTVRHARRMADERLDAAEALGQAEVASAGLQSRARARPALRARTKACRRSRSSGDSRKRVLRMRRQARIVDARDVVARFEELGNHLRVARVLAHAHRQRLRAAHRQPRIVRPGNAAGRVLRGT